MNDYQDLWVKGALVERGQRWCEGRYRAMRPFLDQFRRPFTVLDLGCNRGYYDFRICEDYPRAVVVAVDEAEQMAEACRLNDQYRVLWIRRTITAAEMTRFLMPAAHFDVVLAMSVWHRTSEPIEMYEATRALGGLLIADTPTRKEDLADLGAIEVRRRWYRDSEHISYVPVRSADDDWARSLRWLEEPRERIVAWQPHYNIVSVQATRERKEVEIRHSRSQWTERREWWEGMNLWAFLVLGGAWPTRMALLDMAQGLHLGPDSTACNIILGDGMHVIDGETVDEDAIRADGGARSILHREIEKEGRP